VNRVLFFLANLAYNEDCKIICLFRLLKLENTCTFKAERIRRDEVQYIAVFSGLVTAIVGLLTIYQLLKSTPQKRPGAILGVITVILIVVTVVLASGGGSPNPTPPPTPTNSSFSSVAASPTPTPTPIVTQINQIMSCTNCVTSDNFSLIVKYATFDPAQSQLTLVIGVKNISTDDKSEVQFKYLKLQDTQTGVTTDGGGEGFSSFAISVNSQILFRPTFQFVPVTGHEYSLSAELDSFDLGWAYHLFSPITIKF